MDNTKCDRKCVYFHPFYDEVDKKYKLVCDWYGKDINKIEDRHNCLNKRTSLQLITRRKSNA